MFASFCSAMMLGGWIGRGCGSLKEDCESVRRTENVFRELASCTLHPLSHEQNISTKRVGRKKRTRSPFAFLTAALHLYSIETWSVTVTVRLLNDSDRDDSDSATVVVEAVRNG